MNTVLIDSENKKHVLVDRLLEILRALPDVIVISEPELVLARATRPLRKYETQISLQVADKNVTLLVEVKKALYPRDVRQILWQLKESRHGWSGNLKVNRVVQMIVAEWISPGGKELLRKERVGYFESGGSLFLSTHGVYLHVDKPSHKSATKYIRSLFSGRRSQVLHTLLMHHDDWFGVNTLSDLAKVSSATASQVLTELERFDWLESRGQGPRKNRRLREPAAMLDTWVKQFTVRSPQAMRRYYVPSMQVDQLIQEIEKIFSANHGEYAITHEAAGQYYSPFLSNFSQVRCRLLTGSATNQAIDKLGARAVDEGTNFAVIEANSPGELLFRERMNGVWLASPIQVYLDLIRSEGRTKELAEQLRRERIGF